MGGRPMIPCGLELASGTVHRPFIIDTWLRTYRRIFRVAGLDRERWYEGQREVILDLLPLVQVALRPAAPHTVHAWVCGVPGMLHYVYVARELRRHGIGRALVEACAGDSGTVSHCRPREAASVFRGFVYDPFALYTFLRKAG